jgi:hypothetical protein
METELSINAEGLTKVATHLRTTLHAFGQQVDKFDNTAAALIMHSEHMMSRFEEAVEKLKGTDGWHFYENEPLEKEKR